VTESAWRRRAVASVVARRVRRAENRGALPDLVGSSARRSGPTPRAGAQTAPVVPPAGAVAPRARANSGSRPQGSLRTSRRPQGAAGGWRSEPKLREAATMKRSAVIGVLGTSGGVGASALAAALAVRAGRAGMDVVAVDLSPFGGGLDVTLGAEQEAGVRWADLVALAGAADGSAIVARLPALDGVPVLSFGRDAAVVPEVDVALQVVTALAASGRVVILDMTVEGPYGAAVLALATQLVVVAGSEPRQLAALAVAGRWLQSRCDHVAVCLRGGRRVHEIAPLVESAMGLPVIGLLTEDRHLRADLVHGVAPGSSGRGVLAAVADQCLAHALIRDRAGAA